jgi:uncharacterized membrane protein (UPF0127 family)
MRFPLDVIFVRRDMSVAGIVREVAPFRMVSGGRQAAAVIELRAGWLPEDALRVGDRVELTAPAADGD